MGLLSCLTLCVHPLPLSNTVSEMVTKLYNLPEVKAAGCLIDRAAYSYLKRDLFRRLKAEKGM